MCYLMRVQFFSDGNKRTSMLFDNKMMIENGKGIIRLSLKENFAQNQSFVQKGAGLKQCTTITRLYVGIRQF